MTATAHQNKSAVTFYVAKNGNDAWSGKLPAPNAQRNDGPFATLQRARDAVRELKRQQGGTLKQPVTVFVRSGTHFLTEPLTFTPEDSGTAECPVTFAAYKDEKPVISGGRKLGNWEIGRLGNGKTVWTVTIPEVREGKWMFHQLWVNGQRRVRARHPNEGFLKVAAVPDLQPNQPYNKGQNRFQFAPGDVKAWENLEDVDVVLLHFWVSVRFAVASVDEQKNIVTFTQTSRRKLMEGFGNAPARYYVENALELLDAPGEWYLNRNTGVLYYLPMPGEKMEQAEVIAPALTHLVRLQGEPQVGQWVEHVAFHRLTFAHSEWWLPRNDTGDAQASVAVTGAIQGDGVRHCAFEGCTVAHVSNYAMHLARGCQQNRIVGCEVFDLGAGGVRIGETTIRDNAAEQTHGNEVTDNHIYDGGKTFHQAIGVWVGQSYGNRIAHNHIHDFYYTGISVGWTWGYGRTLTRDNVIEFNHVHDIGRGWLSDMGGIYTLGTQPGTVIRNNVFHDITAVGYGGWGIYFDEGSSEIVAENNLVYRTTHGGFHQHYGKENVVRNNVFAFGRDQQIQRTRKEPHRSFTFERNVVYWREGKLLAGNWDDFNFTLDGNVYCQANGGEIRFGNFSLEDWRAKGIDKNSVIADPLFVNPEKNDFRLKPESPALKQGFVSFDVSRVGPRKEVMSHFFPSD